MSENSFVVAAFPAQGHINPAMEFVSRLLQTGAHVTFVTAKSGRRHLKQCGEKAGRMELVTFSDGYDKDLFEKGTAETDALARMESLRRRGAEALSELLARMEKQGRRITCVIYSLLFSWVAEVARDHRVPSVFLWIQPATVLDIFYRYFNGHSERIHGVVEDESKCVELPGLPPIYKRDLPSFIYDSTDHYGVGLSTFKRHLDAIAADPCPMVLANTFDALEPHARLEGSRTIKIIPVGPLLRPSAAAVENAGEYMEWLRSKPESSVVYVSFGTITTLRRAQTKKIAEGLLATGRPFLWVIKTPGEEPPERELVQRGKIVRWCSQVAVLSHQAVGCFLTHCGWNSVLESMMCGVPMLCFPQWTDQGTNAMLVEKVWQLGVRVASAEDGEAEPEEIRRRVEDVMGPGNTGQMARMNAKKWSMKATQAVLHGGSSINNLTNFLSRFKETGNESPPFPTN